MRKLTRGSVSLLVAILTFEVAMTLAFIATFFGLLIKLGVV